MTGYQSEATTTLTNAGNSEKRDANNIYTTMQGLYMDPAAHNVWVFGVAGSDITEPCLQAATKLQEWFKLGYFNEDANAITYSDSQALFAGGTGDFFITGNWLVTTLYDAFANKEDLGFMLFPPGANGKHATEGSVGLPLVISAKTEYPDLAATYLDYIVSSDAAVQGMFNTNLIPARPISADTKSENPVFNMALAELAYLNQDNGILAWQDWATPRMFDLLGSNLQSLIAIQMTPDAYCGSLQDDWAQFQAGG
jgi:raffinose/stachyose/melibiose transport system substrate-binding protein